MNTTDTPTPSFSCDSPEHAAHPLAEGRQVKFKDDPALVKMRDDALRTAIDELKCFIAEQPLLNMLAEATFDAQKVLDDADTLRKKIMHGFIEKRALEAQVKELRERAGKLPNLRA